MTEKIRSIVASQVTVEIIPEREIHAVRGNALASGDDALDKQVEDEIIDADNQGNEWAWCTVEVRVRFIVDGKERTGSDYLGCVSHIHSKEKGFRNRGGYLPSMIEGALNNALIPDCVMSPRERTKLVKREVVNG